jgi:hypothetical protein
MRVARNDRQVLYSTPLADAPGEGLATPPRVVSRLMAKIGQF